MKKYLIIIFIFSLIALWPFFRKGYFESHDGGWMVIRFTAFHQTLVSGQFPVRFTDRLNNNYGYPVLNFLYPLPFYFAEIPKLLGFGFVDSIKIVFVIATMISALAMFWALNQIFGKEASLVGSILYLYFPYHFLDLYVRGSIGEDLAFAFIPLIFGCILKIKKGSDIFFPLTAIFTACLILSHNVIAVLFLPFLVLISLIILKERKTKIIISFIFGILIASFFWIPAIFDLRYVRFSQIKVANISDYLVNISKLIIPSWGYGPNSEGTNALSVQIGIVPLAIFLSALYLQIRNKSKDFLVNSFLIIFIIISFLMTKISLPFWQHIPFVDIIQFPWRMLSILAFISAFLAAYIIDKNSKKVLLSILIIAAAFISTISYTKPKSFVNLPDSYYATNEDSTTVQNEYLPLWVTQMPAKRADVKIEVGPGEIIQSSQIKPANYKAEILSKNSSQVKVNTIYFPGWQVKVDGKRVPIDYQNKFGLITFKLSKGEHQVIINYTKTLIHLISELISLAAIMMVSVYFYILWRKQNS